MSAGAELRRQVAGGPSAGELASGWGGERLRWRREVYALLAITFRRPPLPLAYGDVATALAELLRGVPWGGTLAGRLAALHVDEGPTLHTALVLLGGAARTPVRLYESCWRDGTTLWGEAAARCDGFYRRVGFVVDEAVHECPDALGVQLELMAHLCDAGDEAEADRFLRTHLLQWAPQAAASLAAAPLPPFFRLMGDVLGRFLAAEEDEGVVAQPARGAGRKCGGR